MSQLHKHFYVGCNNFQDGKAGRIKYYVGKIEGRDAIFLDKILFNTETDLTLIGHFSADNNQEINFEMNFEGVIFFLSIELDFDKRGQLESLAVVQNSDRIKEFKAIDHSSKINDRHKHYYIRSYDTVFEIISDRFELKF